jgi:predicted ATP-grasp superfamily ATP-dependent carboligase
MEAQLRRPWLVAVWPGMGAVAQIAGTYLARQLRAKAVAELDPQGFFEPRSITVKGGLALAEGLPRSTFHAWRNPSGERDLLILIGEQQPASAGLRYAQALMDVAARHSVERVVTFAAMATPIHPAARPRVFGVATREALLPELKAHDVTLLEEGEISGLNGTFLAAAAARDLPAVCLLGEFPFFAAQLPNPKASAAVLEVFARMSGLPVDLAPIRADAAKIEVSLVQHLEQLQRAVEQAGAQHEEAEAVPEPEPQAPPPEERQVPTEALERIESLFAQARQDRQKALELKAELDRHGLFKRYEDRFLDLFKQAG